MSNGGERRQYKRYWRAQLNIRRFVIRDSHSFPVCKNISAGGVMIGAQDAFDKGTEINCIVGLPGWKDFAAKMGLKPEPVSDDLCVRMVVMWADAATGGGFNLGGQFLVDDPAWQKTLEAYLQSHEKKTVAGVARNIAA